MSETRLQLMLRLNAELKVREDRYQRTMRQFDELTSAVRHERAAIEEDKARLAHVARAAERAGEIRIKAVAELNSVPL